MLKSNLLKAALCFLCFGFGGSSCITAKPLQESPGAQNTEHLESLAALTMSTPGGDRYEGGPVVIQIVEGANPPVHISLTATSSAGKTQTALLGASLEMLAGRKLALQIGRRPLRAGGGVVSRQAEGRSTTMADGTVQLELGDEGVLRRTLLDRRVRVTAIEGSYELSCWVRPETLGHPANGSQSPGMSVQVEDDDFHSDFCKRFAPLR
jgi:hypothetical protein